MQAKKKGSRNVKAYITFFLEQSVSKYNHVGSPEMSESLSNYNNNNNRTLIYIFKILYSSQIIPYSLLIFSSHYTTSPILR